MYIMTTKIHNYLFRIIITFVIALLILFEFACQKSNDKPPKMEGPEPEPHKGVFLNDNAVFTFDGSNKTVFVEFDGEYMEELNNPRNNTYYSYVFTWYEFGECRYDVATNLKLYHEKSNTRLDFLVEGNTTNDRIEISYIVPGAKKLVFIKQE